MSKDRTNRLLVYYEHYVCSYLIKTVIVRILLFLGTIVGHRVNYEFNWAQTCLGTVSLVWAQTCRGTKLSGHKNIWAQTCLGTNMSGHKLVWAQICHHSRVGTIMYGRKSGGTIRRRYTTSSLAQYVSLMNHA